MATLSSALTSLPPTADTVELLVRIAGQPLEGLTAASVLDVSVQQTLGQATHLSLRLAAWDPDTDQFTLVDDRVFTPGSTVEVELGFLGQRKPVFWGEIVGLDLEASSSERAVVTLNAYDVLHRLGRGERKAKYEKTTYAAIVRTIAQDIYKIAVDAKDAPSLDPEHPVVFQENTSDLEFLTKLAREIQYELFTDAEGKKLVFRKSQIDQPASLVLDARQDIVEFSGHLDDAGQLGGVEVRAFDTDHKKRINVVVDNPGGLDHRYGSVRSRSLLTELPLLTQEEARSHADAELQRIRATHLTATGTCFGRTDLRPGVVIRLDNLGARFGGSFHVTGATHSLSATGSYRTRFQLEGQPR